MKTENISTLKIHKLSQEQYERELAAGNIDENALYFTPDTGGSSTGGGITEIPSEYITESELEAKGYLTTTSADSKYQPKGTYLTSVPSEYINETELQTHTDQVLSAGEQLVLNGSQTLQNNYNFSQLKYDGSQANNSGGSLLSDAGKRHDIISDFFFTINPNRPLYASFDLKAELGSQAYAYVAFYDVDKQIISASHHMYQPNTLTRLTQDLKKGDTVVHLEDLTNWNETLTANHQRSFIFWNYTNNKGYTYPPETYSRNMYSNLYADSSSIDKTNKTITLSTAWNKATIPAGTYLSQGSSGNNYKYLMGGRITASTEWITFKGGYDGVDYTGKNDMYKLPPGTAFAKFGMFLNYNGVANEKVWLTNIVVKEDVYSEVEKKSDKTYVDTELDKKSDKSHTHSQYLTEIPNEYVTETELSAKGYLTEHQSLSAYSTTAQSDAKYQPKGNYLTEVPSEYITESELTAKKYLTSIPSEYVTDSELNAKGYLTSAPTEVAIQNNQPAEGLIWIDTDSADEVILAEIDDNTTSAEKTWSSTKISDAIDNLNNNQPQIQPLFMNSMEELEANGDTDKLYILPDNFIYAYMETANVEPSYTNLAEPLPDNTTDTAKWVNGYRISSTGISAQSGKTVTNPVVVNQGDVIRVKGVDFETDVDRVALWSSSGSLAEGQYVSALPVTTIGYVFANGVHEFTITGSITNGTIRFAFTTPNDASQIIITKNEKIVENSDSSVGYTNQIPLSTDSSGNVVGLIEGHRYNSSDTLVAEAGVNATGFIPAKQNDTVYFQNVLFGANATHAGSVYIRVYDSSYKELTNSNGLMAVFSKISSNYTLDENGNLTSMVLNGSGVSGCAYIRLAFDPNGEEAIITVNEPIEGTTSSGGGYTNIIDTVGYTDGYRLSTSTGNLSELAGYTTTGFIDFVGYDLPITLRTKGVNFNVTNANIVIYNLSTGAYISALALNNSTLMSSGWNSFTSSFDTDGNLTLTTSSTNAQKDYKIKICGQGAGANLTVTINEEIIGEPIKPSYKNLAEPLPNNTTDTTKWVNGYRISGDGVTAQAGTTVSNTINCKNGDTIRISGVILRENSDRLAFDMIRSDTGEDYLAASYWNATHELFTLNVTDTGVYEITINKNYVHTVKTFRFAMPTPSDASKVIITLNESIDGSTTDGGYINLFDTSGDGFANDTDFSGASSGRFLTNYIPCKDGDIIHVKGALIYKLKAHNGVGDTWGDAMYESALGVATADYDSGVKTYTISGSTIGVSNIDMVQCEIRSGNADLDSVIITVNEKIIGSERVEDETQQPTVPMSKAWTNTGHAFIPTEYDSQIASLTTKTNTNAINIATLKSTTSSQTKDIKELKTSVKNLESGKTNASLPTYWEEYLPNKIATIKALQEAGGKDCFSFPLLTDIHITVNLGKRSGILAKRIMDECYMKYAVCCGDVVTRGANKTKEQMEQNYATVEELLAPIRPQLLQTQGNHDGSYGAEDLDGDGDVEGTEYYCYNYTPQQNYEKIYRKVGLVGDVHFDKTGSGYWIDDVSNKVRYIGMNSHCNKYEENADGTAVYNNMRVFRLTQSQFDMTIEALTTVPSDEWAVLSFSHAPLNNRDGSAFADRIVMRDMLNAYRNKTSYSGTYGTSGAYDYVKVSVDFSNAKGQYVAHFSGHTHNDTVTTDFGIPIVTTRCDGNEENDSTLYAEKVIGTVTEQSFDVFTVNKATGRIYATKIGAGDDRVITYSNGNGSTNLFVPNNATLNYRLNSSYAETSANSCFISDYIDFSYTVGSKITIEGLTYVINSAEATNRIVFFSDSKTALTHYELNTKNDNLFTINTSNLNQQVITLNSIPSGTAYIRLSLYKSENTTNPAAITIDDIQNIKVYVK